MAVQLTISRCRDCGQNYYTQLGCQICKDAVPRDDDATHRRERRELELYGFISPDVLYSFRDEQHRHPRGGGGSKKNKHGKKRLRRISRWDNPAFWWEDT